VFRFAQDNERLAAHSRRVVLFGDSRIQNWSPPLQVEGWDVVNRGIGGDVISHMRHRFAADVLALNPRAVIIQAGINDLVAAAALGTPPEVAAEQTLKGIDSMLEAASRAGVEVFLMSVVRPGPVPLWRRPFWQHDLPDWVARVNDGLRKRAGHGVEFIDADGLLTQSQQSVAQRFALDTLHFTDSAYMLLNTTIANRLRVRFSAF
jgi:lysophospholipase L1-like esterase